MSKSQVLYLAVLRLFLHLIELENRLMFFIWCYNCFIIMVFIKYL